MHVIRQGKRVSLSTPAKLNLFLELMSKRPDGFHELETVMVPINLYDRLVFEGRKDSRIRLDCQWAAGYATAATDCLPAAEENLIYRAVQLLQQRSGSQLGADIYVSKRIPSQAGLGGGSSDAMAALVAANRAWRLGWSIERLANLGGELGSDVSFFAHQALAVCTGRGEKIVPLQARGRLHFVIVKPDFGLSTKQVYEHAQIPTDPKASQSLLAAIQSMDLTAIGERFFNRLQLAASSLTDWITEIRQVMQGLPVLGHQLSGSGTSYFALCRSPRHARVLAAKLRATRLGHVIAATSLG